MADTATFGVDDESSAPGHRSGRMSFSGLFDGSADAVDEELDAILAKESPKPIVAYLPGGPAAGGTAHLAEVNAATKQVQSPSRGMVSVAAELQTTGRVDRARVLTDVSAAMTFGSVNGAGFDHGRPSGSHTVTGASWAGGTATLTIATGHGFTTGETVQVSGVNPAGYNGTYVLTGTAATTISYAVAVNPGAYVSGGLVNLNGQEGGAVAHLHVVDNTYNAGTSAKIQHSPDNSVWADLILFTSVPAGTKASERIATATGILVNRWTRLQKTGGTSGSGKLLAAIGRR
jgi:hypothetical protein